MNAVDITPILSFIQILKTFKNGIVYPKLVTKNVLEEEKKETTTEFEQHHL